MSETNLASFDFTKLVVADLERSAVFYKAVTGITEMIRFEAEICGRPIKEILFNPTGKNVSGLMLIAYTDSKQPVTGEIMVGFSTPDLEAFLARAVAAGGTVAQAIRIEPDFKVRVAFVRDPEGHLLEVVQPL